MTETPVCTRCKKIKPNDQFKLCEKCRTLMRGQYHRLRRAKEIARGQWMADMKAQMSCHDCGASHPEDPSRLIWDHLPGVEKVGNISDMVYKGLVDEVLEEIQKCELVCASCHAKRGVKRGQIATGPTGRGKCLHCQKPFRFRPSHKRRYCSRQCANVSRRK